MCVCCYSTGRWTTTYLFPKWNLFCIHAYSYPCGFLKILFNWQCTQEHVLTIFLLKLESEIPAWEKFWRLLQGSCFFDYAQYIPFCQFSSPYFLWFIPWVHRNLDNDFTYTESSGCLIASHNIFWALSGKLKVKSKGSSISSPSTEADKFSLARSCSGLLFCNIMSSGWSFSPFPTLVCLHLFYHLHKNSHVT